MLSLLEITFNQEVDHNTHQQAGTGLQQGSWKPHRQDLAVGKEPPLIPSSGVPTSKNEREASEDEDELARDRKKTKVFEQRRYQKTE